MIIQLRTKGYRGKYARRSDGIYIFYRKYYDRWHSFGFSRDNYSSKEGGKITSTTIYMQNMSNNYNDQQAKIDSKSLPVLPEPHTNENLNEDQICHMDDATVKCSNIVRIFFRCFCTIVAEKLICCVMEIRNEGLMYWL